VIDIDPEYEKIEHVGFLLKCEHCGYVREIEDFEW
jgi:hypothetical protein